MKNDVPPKDDEMNNIWRKITWNCQLLTKLLVYIEGPIHNFSNYKKNIHNQYLILKFACRLPNSKIILYFLDIVDDLDHSSLLSASMVSLASSTTSLASEILDRAEKRRNEFWGKRSKQTRK